MFMDRDCRIQDFPYIGVMKPIIASPETVAKTSLSSEHHHSERALADAVMKSRLYRDYERAFSTLTGLPIAFQPVDSWQLSHHHKQHENPLCALLTQQNSSCAACLQTQEEVRLGAKDAPKTITCAVGLSDSAIPVKLNDRLIGYLLVGQIFRKKPTVEQFEKVVRLAEKWGLKADRETLKKAFFSGKVISPKEHSSAIKLLTIFADQLSALSNQFFIQNENAEPPSISKARAYIEEHQQDELSLGQVAQAVNMSTFYFCKLFKKHVGIPFTEYVARVRIERSRNLLLNPNLRVS